jgi:hypothetical protein
VAVIHADRYWKLRGCEDICAALDAKPATASPAQPDTTASASIEQLCGLLGEGCAGWVSVDSLFEGFDYEFFPGENPRGCNCGHTHGCTTCAERKSATPTAAPVSTMGAAGQEGDKP